MASSALARTSTGAPRKVRRLKAVTVDQDYLDSVKSFAEGLPKEFVNCRELGHNWVPHTVTRYRNAFVRKLRCTRCKTKKVQQIDSSGMLSSNTYYEHPEGYLMKGLGSIRGEGRGLVRLVSIMHGRITEVDEDF